MMKSKIFRPRKILPAPVHAQARPGQGFSREGKGKSGKAFNAQDQDTDAYDEVNRTSLDMTGWEDAFHYEDMRGLFFIQKGQYRKSGLCVTVKDGHEYEERYLGGYNPNGPDTDGHYCVMDRITFHSIYGGSSLNAALDCLTRCIVNYHNDPELYFRDICEVTNEDFYTRHYENGTYYSETVLKKKSEDGKSWRTSPHMKRLGYAVSKIYGDFFSDEIQKAEESAIKILDEKKRQSIARKKEMKCRKIRLKR